MDAFIYFEGPCMGSAAWLLQSHVWLEMLSRSSTKTSSFVSPKVAKCYFRMEYLYECLQLSLFSKLHL